MYKFSHIVGRLITGSKPSITHGLQASEKTSKIIYGPHVEFPKIKEKISVPPTKPGFGQMSPKMLQKYKHFQTLDGVPVHLKGGQVDKVLYYSTLVMCVIGLEECFRYYYRAAFPKKTEAG